MALMSLGAATLAFAGSSRADVSEVSGDAYGHYTNVGLFGGPPAAKGPAPAVVLPSTGADPAVTATESSGSAIYGPAYIFGGQWPDGVARTPPSGPITVSTKGKTGPDAYVTSTVDIGLHPKPLPVQCVAEPPGTTNCSAPGGFGPLPVTQGDELHSTCTATETSATGSVRFVNATLAISTDLDGAPTDIEPVPDNPPVNYTREGEITNVGGNWKIIFNEQILEPDGSITVNAYHMFLLKLAVGEQIVGHVRCSPKGAATSATTPVTAASTASTPSSAAASPGSARPEAGTDALPWVLAAATAVGGVAVWLIWSRRRRTTEGEHREDEPGAPDSRGAPVG